MTLIYKSSNNMQSNLNETKLKMKLLKHYQGILLATILVSLLTGCYRMPTDDDYSLVPTTNNPSVTRETGGGLVPGGNF